MIDCHKANVRPKGDAGAQAVAAPRGPINHRAGSSKEAAVSFEVGVGSYPYLSDHGFHDMIVLPGSFYIELAIRVHMETLRAPLGAIRRVEFQNPVILTEGEVTLWVGMVWLDDQTVQYSFGEPGEPTCAILEINCDLRGQANAPAASLSVDAFQNQAGCVGGPADFYGRLSENGNQYGPHFQVARQFWRCGADVLGRVCVGRNALGTQRHYLNPVLLDGAAQLLSAFYLDQGRTFILQGIQEISVLTPDLPDEVWVHARLRPEDGATEGGRVGDLDVFDDSGALRLRLTGVKFAYLDRPEPREKAAQPKTNVVVASTFIAEPVEDSLQFWGDYLELPVQVNFAPYNQVFQELLNPASQLRRNQDGLNVILLNLRDWVVEGRAANLALDAEKAAACFEDFSRHTLPNGLEIAHLNRHETEYVYKEIFDDQCYLRHGIRLPDDATVIDIGANIGLFSLFVRTRCPRASVYAFEPSPAAFQVLKANCDAYGPGLRAFHAGVSERRGTATLTSYENSSVFSSFHASTEEDRQAIEAVVANMIRSELGPANESVDEYVQELTTNRLNRQTFECPLTSVSDIIRDNGLQRVDLLKVDAEKCELEILRGIDADHWGLIDQVVVEVHDRSRRLLGEVQAILGRNGFECSVEEEKLLAGSGLFNVYATRRKSGSASETEQSLTESPTSDLRAKVDQFVQALDSFARAAGAPTILCLCPSGGKNSPPSALDDELIATEDHLAARVRDFPRIEVIRSEAVLGRYPTADFHDPHANDVGHVPYTPEGFAAIGSSVFRTHVDMRRMPYKVIVLDCDNTLWKGACGEEGPLGVAVTPDYRKLQEFAIRQRDAGMLLCLCSKNSEADVWAVFAQHPGMALKREDFAAVRINWAPKSENLRSLAKELNVGMESIIFLDDNPVECAEAHAKCPEVVALQLPSDSGRLARFLDHAWAFDHLRITEEDRARTQKVLENAQREIYRGQASTLKDFIDGLQLEAALFEPTRDQISRVSQLTFRTNQFNFTTIRRSEADVTRFLETEGGHCLAAKVSDRFGDYGMVGLLLYRVNDDRYAVDTFLLSCRVLGRGAEHQILAKFGRLALEDGKQWVDFPFRHSDKNEPAWRFINSVAAEFARPAEGGAGFLIPAEKLSGLRYDPSMAPADRAQAGGNDSAEAGSKPGSVLAAAIAGRSDKFQRIADGLNGAKEICAAIEANRMRASAGGGDSPGSELPATLAGKMLGIWRNVLGNARIGMNDNFAEAGGTSLKAVRLAATIRRELLLHVSIVNIFECPTVRLLCEKLEPGKTVSDSAGGARERGARRKQRARKSA